MNVKDKVWVDDLKSSDSVMCLKDRVSSGVDSTCKLFINVFNKYLGVLLYERHYRWSLMCLDSGTSQSSREMKYEHEWQASQIGNDKYHLCGGDNKDLRGRNDCSLVRSS